MQLEIPEFTLRNSPFPLIAMDDNLTILGSSKSVASFFEQPGKYQFKTFKEIFGEVPQGFIKAIKQSCNCVETLSVISKTGRLRWIKTSIFPMAPESKIFQVYFDDVTEEKVQYELAIQAKQIAKIGSWKVDLLTNVVSWSNLTRDIHEVPQDFAPDLDKGINFYKKGVHRDKIVEVVSECIEKGKPFDLESIIVTAQGNEKWVRAIGEAEISNGKTIGFKGVFQDIDEIKRERLRNQVVDNRMRLAVQSANIGIWDWDVVSNDLIWDDNMFALFEVDPEKFEHAYEAWESSLHPDDKEKATHKVQRALKGEKDFDTEFRIIKQDGSIAHIQARAQVVRDEKGMPLRMVGINSDITRIKRKDERLRNLLELTEKQNQKLVNFAHIVSHNLRSNSANISMLSGMLLSENILGRRKEFIGMIQKSSEKLEDTLNQLNEIVKIQATDKNDLTQLGVRPILKDVCDSINAIIEQCKAKITISIDENLKVRGIKPYLTSIFLNLLTNSIKYRAPHKEPKITVEAKILKNQTILIFKDNGLGIDLKKHGKNLFGMYKTFHDHKDSKGIGLFISKNQMEAMNGKIEVKSQPGAGSTFYLYFKNES
ncbi:MAG: PAS domain-containing protein [Bacteroidota bacterium]